MAAGEMIDTAIEAASNLPRDLAVLKMENDQIFSMAAARPRDFKTIKAELTEMIASFPQFADEAIYEKPVGQEPDRCTACNQEIFRRRGVVGVPKQCPVCKADGTVVKGEMKFARGLSVRAAECLAECYGFNRIHTDVEVLPDERVKVYASFTDYQRGRTWEDSTIVSPFYRSREGQMNRHPEDRFFNVIVKAEKSKLVREVINRSINQPLKAWFEAECETSLGQTLDDAAIAKIVKGFASYGVTEEQVEHIVGRPRSMGWVQQDRVRLVGVFNALKSGETKPAELFAHDAAPERPQPASGTVDSLTNPTGKTVERPHQSPTTTTPPSTTSPQTTAKTVEAEVVPPAEKKLGASKSAKPATTAKTPVQVLGERLATAATLDELHAVNVDIATDERLSEMDRDVLLRQFKERKAALGVQ